MKTRRHIKTLLALLAIPIGANATVSLDSCQTLAKNNYPLIKQYDLVNTSASYTLDNAAKNYLPKLVLSAQATLQNHVSSYPEPLEQMLKQKGLDVEGMHKDQYKLALELNQIIWDGGQTKASQAITKAETEQQTKQLDVSLYQIEQRVNNLYFGILQLKAKQEQTNVTIELLNNNLKKMQSLIKNGVAMQTDADAIEAELLTLQQSQDQIADCQKGYETMLSHFTGTTLKADDLETPSENSQAAGTSGGIRPEEENYDAQLVVLNERENAIKASLMPHINLFGQAYYGYPGYDMMNDMLEYQWSFNALIGLKATWSISSLYTKKNDLNQIETGRQQIAVQRETFRFNNQLETDQEESDIARLRQQIATDEKIVELRQKVRKAAESKLRNGVIDTNDLLSKISDEDKAVATRNAHQIELLKTIYDYKHTTKQ